MARRTVLQGSGVLLTALTIWTMALIGWNVWQGQDAEWPPAMPVSGEGVRVATVLATDRLQLADGREVRLAALRVPAAGAPFADEGRAATRALAEGKEVRMEGPAEAAFLFLPDGQLLQQLLLSGGYARLAEQPGASSYLALLREAERQARDANAGVWRGAPVPTLPPTAGPLSCDPALMGGDAVGPSEAAARVGEEVTVVFLPPRATTDNGAVTLLQGFGGGEDFGVTIPAGLASTVRDPALIYINRCLAVEGRVERDAIGSPRIVLRAFEQLLILR